ncbi:MAG TPA: hypothetical protein VN421_09570 [Pseudoflavonifractor sp.]|nr:hypothetical protein [Pseudoflavonifractor sp.]
MTKLEALNSIMISDSSCSCGEVEYILADLTAASIKTLLDAGFTVDQIDEAMEDGVTGIDLSTLAFNHADATWWSSKSGFVANVVEERKCRICGCTQDNACPGGCYWVAPDLCSACVQEAGEDEL